MRPAVRKEGLGHRRKRGALDPEEELSGGIEDRDTRQRHRPGQHADEEKVAFDMVHAVAAADELGLVKRTDDEGRGTPVVRRRSGRYLRQQGRTTLRMRMASLLGNAPHGRR